MTSSMILQELEKLKTTGSVLYVAAHPDDENTALLTYLAQEEKLDTAYLSLTRGGGGQNLIGSELKEALGLIRANELLQARKIDGAKQLFTRARDFGYSKDPEDTLENWDEQSVLGDVVYAVRYFRPDLIITRFNPEAGPTHGHHTVSAQLALRAFSLAADPGAFPEQLQFVEPHQAKRIFWNEFGSRELRSGESEGREVFLLQIGKYNPYLGTSYTEIAARSRSMHKSQGFGRAGERGSQVERLVLLKGASAEGNLLKGIDTTWQRYESGKQLDDLLNEVIRSFDVSAPWKSVSRLLEVDELFDSLPDERFARSKRETLHKVIAAAMGIHFEARSEKADAYRGESLAIEIELINRSPLTAFSMGTHMSVFSPKAWPEPFGSSLIDGERRALSEGEVVNVTSAYHVANEAPLTQPYWLTAEPTEGLYRLENLRLRELESIPSAFEVGVELEIEGRSVRLTTPLIQRISDPVKGEISVTTSIRPKLTIEADASALLFDKPESKEVALILSSADQAIRGTVMATAPSGWEVAIENPNFTLDRVASEQTIVARISPPAQAEEAMLSFEAIDSEGTKYDIGLQRIDYDHIGRQALLKKARFKAILLDLKRPDIRVAYVEGVGDRVPDVLDRIGYQVDRLPIEGLNEESLKKYDTIILGPRVFDAYGGIDKRFPVLLDYVEAGGTLISQYNTTSSQAKSKFTAPYPLTLSRDRVSEENAEMRILQPRHPVFNFPNKITNKDFDNWIQERGLYFADSWDQRYTALISANDRGEPPREGGLLVTQYGKGWYAYTGLSFFRQLLEGNPGAIRLFVNLISLGHGSRLE